MASPVRAGFAGSVMARRLHDAGKKVLVVDRRDHVGGYAYDELNEKGVLVRPRPGAAPRRRWPGQLAHAGPHGARPTVEERGAQPLVVGQARERGPRLGGGIVGEGDGSPQPSRDRGVRPARLALGGEREQHDRHPDHGTTTLIVKKRRSRPRNVMQGQGHAGPIPQPTLTPPTSPPRRFVPGRAGYHGTATGL